FEGSVVGKLVETLHELAPVVERVIYLFSPDMPGNSADVQDFEAGASRLAMKAGIAPVRNGEEIERAIEGFASQPRGGLVVSTDTTLITYRHTIIALAQRYRLPAIFARRSFVSDGGLVSYGIDLAENYRG